MQAARSITGPARKTGRKTMCFCPVGERDHAIEAVRLMNESKIFPVGSKGSTELRERANFHAAQAGVCALKMRPSSSASRRIFCI